MKYEITKISRNQSSREGGRPKLIVLHTTEGPDGKNDLLNLGGWFDNPNAGVSSHTANNVRGMAARYVEDEKKSWAACNLNPVALNLEQIAYASFSKDTWMRDRHLQLKDTAVQIAAWSEKWGIPIQRGKNDGSTCTRPGVVQHKDLGSAGCGHSDCGPGYPMRYVMALAQLIQLEHFQNKGNTRTAKRKRRKINRMRKAYGLKPFIAPK